MHFHLSEEPQICQAEPICTAADILSRQTSQTPSEQLPQRAARVSDEIQADIVRLALRYVPHVTIAARTGVYQHTVKRLP